MKNKYFLLCIFFIAFSLRFWRLDLVPSSLFGDEVDVGYHAYSILKTGKDYSGNFMPLHFQSMAEWRTPLYLYASVPSVAAFGISPWGVRLPAAIFGFLGVIAIYFLIKEMFENELMATIGAFVLAVSPWHIQYSRAGFEVTMMLFFMIMGILFFLKSFKSPKLLYLSILSLSATPWIYSTSKFFTPFFVIALVLIYWKKLIKTDKKIIGGGILLGLIFWLPLFYITFLGGAAQRFNYISVFSDPTVEHEVGQLRLVDGRLRGDLGTGLAPTLFDRIFHNKFVIWSDKIMNNYFQSFSTDFLFNNGDPNLRHSIKNIGQFYKVDIVPLLLGLITIFFSKISKDKKLIIFTMLILSPFSSAITRDGGNHATRLILMIIPFAMIMAYGLWKMTSFKFGKIIILIYSGLLIVNFSFYQHNFWNHNRWDSERWWHYGWQEAVSFIKENDSSFDGVIITSADEPPWIFFAAHYMFDPNKWHQNYPFNKKMVDGLGEVSYIDKYYFGNYSGVGGVYDWGKVLDNKTLYLASAKEVNVNLIAEPERTPKDLVLLKSVAFPSGEPAFYIFTKNK